MKLPILKKLTDKAGEYLRTYDDIQAMEAIAPLVQGRYLPWTTTSMRPFDIQTILNDIVLNKRCRIVEFGSGVSTFLIAELIADKDGVEFVSVEHDPHFADFVDAELCGISNVEIVHAPLTFCQWSKGNSDVWYDTSALDYHFGDRDPFDLIIIDGPPSFRDPTVPFMIPYMADDYTIVLDDMHREYETMLAKKWSHELGVEFQKKRPYGKLGVARSVRGYKI